MSWTRHGATGALLYEPAPNSVVRSHLKASPTPAEALPGRIIEYQEVTSSVNITSTNEASPDTLITCDAITLDGSTQIIVEFYCPVLDPSDVAANRYVYVSLWDGSTDLGRMCLVQTQVAGVHNYLTAAATRVLTPSAASHTYKARGFVSAGTAVAFAGTGGTAAFLPMCMTIRAV